MDPEEIEERQFVITLRGYARDEVESFREEVAQEIKILRKQLTKANSDLSHASSELERVKSQLAEARAQLEKERSRPAPEPETPEAAPEPALPEDRAAVFRMVGQETERILLAAEQAAEQMHERAVKESAEIMTDARLKVQRSMAELEAARRAAEEDFEGIRDTRNMVASQLEDIRRRLEETVSRLLVPVELPGPKPARSRLRPEGERPAKPPPGGDAGAQSQHRQEREREAAQELRARQTAHLEEAGRREAELRAVQADREARERAEHEEVSRRAQARAAAAAQDAERLRAAREAELQKEAQEAELRNRQAEQAAREEAGKAAREEAAKAERKARERAEAAAKEQAKAQAEAAANEARAKAEVEKAAQAKAQAEAAAKEARAKAEVEKAAQAKAQAEKAARAAPAARTEEAPKPQAGPGGSSLNELLEEIRRKREQERSPAAEPEPAQPDQEKEAQPQDPELARRNESLGDLPQQTARRLKRLLQEDHNDLLDRLRTQRGKGGLDDHLAPINEQLGRFEAGLREALGRAFKEGSEAGGGKAEVDASPAVNKLVNRQVLNPLRTEVSRAVEAGLKAEDSASALSERVNDVFRVWKGVRTQLLGEGLSFAAYHQGLLDSLSGVAGAQKAWVLDAEEHECPNEVCRRNADAGPVGLKAAFPSGHQAPPAHGGCTCTLKKP